MASYALNVDVRHDEKREDGRCADHPARGVAGGVG